MRTRTLLAAAALLGLPLAACGPADDGGDVSVPAITGRAERATTAEPTSGASPTSGPAGTADAATTAPADDGALAAITLAEREVGGTAVELDRDDDGQGWEVSVAVGGEEVDVDVNAEGTEVLRTDGGDRLDDDERAALEGAALTLADAVRTALEEIDGPLEDVELDDEEGAAVWKVGIGDDEVYVELATGAVLTVDRD